MSSSELPPITDSRLTTVAPTGSYKKNENLTISAIRQRQDSGKSQHMGRDSNSSSSHSYYNSPVLRRPRSGGTHDRENSANSKNSKLGTVFESNGMSRLSRKTNSSGSLVGGFTNQGSHGNPASKPPLKRTSNLKHSASEGQLSSVGRNTPRSRTAGLRRNNSEMRIIETDTTRTVVDRRKFRASSMDRGDNHRASSMDRGDNQKTTKRAPANGLRHGLPLSKSNVTLSNPSLERSQTPDSSAMPSPVNRASGAVRGNDRILQWLIGVDDDPEPPPEQLIDYPEPSQTDTAVHVVYKEK